MKKLLLLTVLLNCVFLSFAQVDERKAAMQLVESNKLAIGLSTTDLRDAIIHTTYQVPTSDIRMVYLQQGYKGIPVYNQMQVLAFRNGKMVSNAGGLLPDMSQRTANHSGIPAISALQALNTAMRDRNVNTAETPVARAVTGATHKYEFGKLSATSENITAELLWLPLKEGKEVKLVWQIFLTPLTSSDYWLVRVDAATNAVIDIQNLTITCNWDGEKHSVNDHFDKKHFNQAGGVNYVLQRNDKTKQWQYRPFIVNNATYRVIKYPAESPQHPGGAHTLHTNPWTWAPGPATALGWHNDGSVYYDSLRGNNAFAYEDRDANNLPGLSALSSTAQPDLNFNFSPDYTLEPIVRTPAPNQQFNTTNLFYWNNLMHDIAYVYGFTEAARNFQNNNQGLGGAGNDYVLAEAQDGSGTNNANFATPADGSRPRMQMYLWTAPTPDRDGDVDNGIIAHEFTHGISNRLTGSGIGCLGNAEQMGEGWSDYYALMVTHDWTTALSTDGFTKPRGVGTYALNQPITGVGIRQYPYTTNMAVNPMTLANLPTVVHPHGTGTIWCTVLWDMTWEIIQTAGINPNLFQVSPSITGGNNIALKLVQEGLRLQPCSPGFIDGRNAILRADTLFFGAQYSCAIMRAFARRGMGINASQGSAGSRNDQVVDFNDGGSALSLTQTAPLVQEGQDITYTNTVAALCSPLVNHTVVDTLPSTVTYVSGGVYDNVNRTVTFTPVNVAVGAPQTYSYTVNVNAGTYFPPIDYLNEVVAGPPPAIPATWTATSTTASVWVVSNVQSNSAPNSFFTPNSVLASHQVLRLTNPIALNNFPASRTILSFWHSFNTEAGWDGGVVEVSTNGGGTWTDLGSKMVSGVYNGTLGAAPTNQLQNRTAFTGNSAGFIKTEIDLSAYGGQNVLFRFRFGSDDNTAPAGGGWYIDDILVRSEAYIKMRSSLFNGSMVRVKTSDTLSKILPAVCTPPSITTQPASIVRCTAPGSASFSVTALGTALTYQWQLSTNGGTSWSNIAGATNNIYSLASVTTALNGNLYRCIITGFCGAITSDAAIIYISPALTHSGVSASPSATCAPGASAITGTVSGGTAATNAVIGSTGLINLAIPDDNATGINSTITLPALTIQQAANLKIRLNLGHSWSGDVKVTLTSPCGTTFVFDRPGVPPVFGNADNFGTDNTATPPPAVYLFDLAGATIIPETPNGVTEYIAAGTYLPSNDATPGVSHNWAGITFPCSTAGVWTLNISDNGSGDLGTLAEWAILTSGNYTHTLTGPGTIVQNAPTGANNSTGNFSVSALPPGSHSFTLTSTDILGCSVSSNVIVNVNNVPAITAHPADRTICAGQNTTFSITDNSALPPTYQWQINQGSGFVNLADVAPFSGVTTSTLTITAAGTVYNGNTFRCIVTNNCGSATSNIATLTVNPLPTVNVGPSGQCGPVLLTASGNSDTYAWTPATGLSATTGASVTASPTTTTTYTVTGTITATGCQNSANVTVLGTPATPVVTPANPVICAGTITQLSVAPTAATFSSAGSITIPAAGTSGPASPYPSAITISGLPTTGVTVKSITINGMTHTFPNDVDVLLRSPSGTNVVIMSDVGGAATITNRDYTFDDAAAAAMTTGTNPSGTYKPSNSGATDTWVAPGPGSVTQATPLLSSLTGDLNGTWNLFVADDAGGDIGSISNWSITFNVSTARWTPATGLYTDAGATIPYVAGTFLNTVYANPAATTTYTVTNTLGTCNAPASTTVTVTVNPVPTVSVSPNNQCGPVTLTATGTANTYSWSPAAGLNTTTGTTVIANPTVNTVYTVTGTITATGCTSIATATVNATPAAPVVTPSSVSICLGATTQLSAAPVTATFTGTGTITIPAGAPGTSSGPASPYPSVINVSGLPASGVRVKSVTLNGVTHTFPTDIDVLLRSPSGTNVVMMSDVGGTSAITNRDYTFDDAAATTMPTGTAAAGTYRPTNSGATDVYVAPGPGSVTQGTPALSMFGGNPNGAWNLFVVDDIGGDVGSFSNWSITFEITGAVWSPVTGLYTDAGATIPYVAGASVSPVFAKPTTTTTYTVTRATATCTSPATSVTVTVLQPLAITTQPANQAVCQGATATFSVVSSGNQQSYQWQVNTGSGFTDISNANNASLVLTNVTTAMSGYQYRVLISNGCFSVTSNTVTLTVNAVPVVTATPLTGKICISDTLVPLTGLPVGGSWSGIGVSGNNFIPPATAVGTYTLTYTYTSPAGCVNKATVTAKVEDCPERIILLRDNAVILWPNPNNGRFNIRINSVLYNYLGMRVFTAAGQLVRMQNFGGLVFGRVIPIDLTSLPGGVYMVKFYYDDGVRTSEKTFKVVVGR